MIFLLLKFYYWRYFCTALIKRITISPNNNCSFSLQ